MEKELPIMYRKSIDKEINNVQNIYSTIDNNLNNSNDINIYNVINIEKKINNILNSSKFVYKADVNIVTDKGLLKKRIIAKKNGFLITIDNEKIPTYIIKDIY